MLTWLPPYLRRLQHNSNASAIKATPAKAPMVTPAIAPPLSTRLRPLLWLCCWGDAELVAVAVVVAVTIGGKFVMVGSLTPLHLVSACEL